jgi:hypothetical protein
LLLPVLCLRVLQDLLCNNSLSSVLGVTIVIGSLALMHFSLQIQLVWFVVEGLSLSSFFLYCYRLGS